MLQEIIEDTTNKRKEQAFNPNDHVFLSDDDDGVGFYIQTIYDDLLDEGGEPSSPTSINKKNNISESTKSRVLMEKALLGSTDRIMLKSIERNYFQE